ncbi:MAG: DUF4468 domain-containing protein [bacterium]|nr:DUF4468 domain-containing protein [bacterium]
MKKMFFISLICLFLSACGKDSYVRNDGYAPNESHIEYIVEYNKTKNEAYSIAENWIAKKYNSANNVIQQKDKENGVIVVKAIAPCVTGWMGDAAMTGGYANYTLEVRMKDNKSKISFDLGGMGFTNGPDRPECAPPTKSMPALKSYFKNIKDEFVKEWNNSTKQDNF